MHCPPTLAERVDDLAGQADHARLECGEKPHGAGADDQHVGADGRRIGCATGSAADVIRDLFG
jgi:hypothetical protein